MAVADVPFCLLVIKNERKGYLAMVPIWWLGMIILAVFDIGILVFYHPIE